MKRIALIAALVALLAPGQSASGAAAPARDTVQIFVGGGTLLSNGIFFPGTAGYYEGQYYGPPYQMAKGSDIELTNLDEGSIANGHQMRSFKQKRGRPLFISPRLDSPGESAIVITSHLKPGIYDYFCTNHFGMFGRIEITR